ncbi:Hamartin protein-domain-containing protein [Linnemannia elongata]|nr:Hamartin protein-domain-containing protein [Linnemannia elongata]
MSSSTPTVKDLYRVVTADLTAYIAQDRSKEQEPTQPRDTIQAYLDRFIKANGTSSSHHHHAHHNNHHLFGSAPSTPLSASAHTSIGGSVISNLATAGHGVAAGGPSTVGTPSATTPGGAQSSTAAAGQRHVNELWYQTLTNNLQPHNASNLPFAFHRLSQSSSPSSSMPVSQTVSVTGSPIMGSAGASLGTGQGASAAPNMSQTSSPSIQSTGFTSATTTANTSLAAQRFSAHLVTLYTQQGMDKVPIALVASRMIVYLTHLLPFLSPQLIILDWWDRLIEPALQGEIKLEKESLKACRDLVTDCMTRDPLLDNHGSGTGSWLVAGDEEGQLDNSQAMNAMPIPQYVLRKYIQAAHKLNHRLEESDQANGASGWWGNAKLGSNLAPAGHAGHGGTNTRAFAGAFSASSVSLSSSATSNSHQRPEYPPAQQDLESQQRLFNRARAIIRRKKDILVKNLETILVAYGGGVGRVKDFFSCLYTYFVGAKYRAEILGLLCQFIRRQRVHLHQILATPLFDSLLLSLKNDTSPLIVSLGLMTLIMLMPRIPATLNDRLPELFLILSRILCWPRSRQQLMAVAYQEGNNLTGQTLKSFDEFEESSPSSSGIATNKTQSAEGKAGDAASSPDDIEYEDIPLHSYGIRWRRYGPAMPGGTSEGAPDPTAIFSFLYGMYPCNLLKFLHAPRKYISEQSTPVGSPKQGSNIGSPAREGDSAVQNPEETVMSPKEPSIKQSVYIDEDLLKSRVQNLLKRHSLHPDLLTLSCEQELSNKARWQKLEPMEIVAMCVGLDVWSAGGLYGMGPVLRSIEEDPRGAVHEDSDENDDENDATTPTGGRAPDGTLASGSHIRESSVQSLARASVESFASEESEGTPIEILAQEDFFGPRLVNKENSMRPLNPGSNPNFLRGPTQPFTRSRTNSKDVKMSHILRNYATLRGLDQEDYINEVAQSKSLGPGVAQRERRGSSRRSSGAWSSPAAAVVAALEAVTPDGPVAPTSGESSAMTTPTDSRRGSISQPINILALTQLNREYREMIVHLERDLLMAKNELNFELFLKQQHIQQISKVHRAHVLDASVEAERQNLYNTCRSLKAQLHETRALLEKEKSELERRKNKQTHWDTELKNKVQTFRDERKQLQFEVERLKQDIRDTRQAQEIQERLLTEERKGTFQLKNSIEDLSPKLKRMEEYEKRIEEMTRQLVLWETEQSKNQETQRQMESVVSRWQSLELLLAAEKEESRLLRNRVSQQSQVMDDLKIQIAMMEGRLPNLQEDSSTDHSEDESIDDENDQHSKGGSIHNGTGEMVIRKKSARRKLPMGMGHQNSGGNGTGMEVGWPSGFSRSNSSQNGFDQHRRAEAMQEFMAKEKERWDQELQQAHNKWSMEAVRNQELEERILELQGQVEMAQAIGRRQQHFGIGHQGGHPGDGSGGSGDITRGEGGLGGVTDGGPSMMNMPSKPQDVPRMTPTRGMRMHDQFAEVDTDDGGVGSSGMFGRYSQRQPESTEDEDDDPRMRQRGNQTNIGDGQSTMAHHTSMSSSSSSRSKGKSTKPKTKAKWLQQQSQQLSQPPPSFERAQSDRSSNSHLGMTGPLSILDLTRSPHPSAILNPRMSTESSSTTSSSAAARAASGGLFPPTMYTRNMSHLSDGGSSDVTTASDSSTTGSATRRTGDGNSSSGRGEGRAESVDGNGEGGSGSGSGTGSGNDKKKSSKSKTVRDRERDKIRMMSGMGPLVDPSKMYRNVRMI